MAVVEFTQGTQAFLNAKLAGLLAAMNADLAAKVTGAVKPAFTYVIGDVPSAKECRLCCAFVSDLPTRSSDNHKAVAVGFKVLALIPVAGDNTSSNFEMAKQVSHDHVQTFLDDDEQSQTPLINAGLIGACKALEASRGAFMDIFPRRMADGTTYVHGWECMYTATYSLKTR